MRLLVSVRSVGEALLVAGAGVDFIDLKEPGQGALGGLPLATIREIAGALRAHGVGRPVSATIGDVPMAQQGDILARVAAVAACGVDYVKVGIAPGEGAEGVLRALAGCGARVVPVFLADLGLDGDLLDLAVAQRFEAIMADTADKAAGSLTHLLPAEALQGFVARARRGGALVGLAGSLRLSDLPALRKLGPDFAGFRGAVCDGRRAGPIDPGRVDALVNALAHLPDTRVPA
jgi:(5-formylfuran-3-yl)methyl phosphate synthase